DAPHLSVDREELDRDTLSKLQQDCTVNLGEIVKNMIPPGNAPVLIVGLGNPEITSDSLGPKVDELTMATRHLFIYMADYIEEGFVSTALFAPDVMGHTGIEAADSVKAVAATIGAKAVITIDALAAASVARVGSSLQITDTGITPGGGLGNIRTAISKESIGIPVIAIGVPTVISLGAILGAALENTAVLLGKNKSAAVLDETTAADIIGTTLAGRHGDYAITPKDIDDVVTVLSKIIALGLHLALHEAMTIENYQEYLDMRL
ncbi:MAG: GPR endopeptidase, partial [Bacillota bacterium]|nr:GPR endopeptidase [Bacillota bacterium]